MVFVDTSNSLIPEKTGIVTSYNEDEAVSKCYRIRKNGR